MLYENIAVPGNKKPPDSITDRLPEVFDKGALKVPGSSNPLRPQFVSKVRTDSFSFRLVAPNVQQQSDVAPAYVILGRNPPRR